MNNKRKKSTTQERKLNNFFLKRSIEGLNSLTTVAELTRQENIDIDQTYCDTFFKNAKKYII